VWRGGRCRAKKVQTVYKSVTIEEYFFSYSHTISRCGCWNLNAKPHRGNLSKAEFLYAQYLFQEDWMLNWKRLQMKMGKEKLCLSEGEKSMWQESM
jgi:hypothetical protein